MAPKLAKRQRGADEASRPKKKFKKVKPRAYHSSSEDESQDDEDGTSTPQFIARDAPRRPQDGLDAVVSRPDKAASSIGTNGSKPRSILKPPMDKSKSTVTTGISLDDATALRDNTMLNVVAGQDSDDNDDDVEEDLGAEALREVNDDDESDDAPQDDVDEFDNLEDEDRDDASDDVDDEDQDSGSDTASATNRPTKKRNDPSAFALSISKILDTKLSNAKRQDPVLSRSKDAADASRTIVDEKLEQKARAQIRAEKRQALEKGRVKDVLGLQTPEIDTGAVLEEEKRLKKTAQRGVVKLFNAVRAAQVKVEEAMVQARSEGVVGMQKRDERVNEMSKQGFLDLISSGGKQGTTTT